MEDAILILITGLVALFGTPFYIVSALASFKLMRLVNYKKNWLAWIPIFNMYGLIDAFRVVINGFPIFNYSVSIKTFKIIWGIGTFLPILGLVSNTPTASIIVYLLNILVKSSLFTYIYATMESTDLKQQKILGLVSGFIPIIAIIKFFLYNVKNLENNNVAELVLKTNSQQIY